MKIPEKTLGTVAALFLFVASIPYADAGRGIAAIQGTVTIGPLCPVEPCDAVPDFSAYRVVLKQNDQVVDSFRISADGKYVGKKLQAGTYVIDIDPNHWQPICLEDQSICYQPLGSANVPATIDLLPRTITTFDVDIDTGIR